MAEPAPLVMVSVRVPDDLHRRVRVYAAVRGERLQDVYQRALEREVGDFAVPSGSDLDDEEPAA